MKVRRIDMYKFSRKESYEHRKGIEKNPFIELAGKRQKDARRDRFILIFINVLGLILALFGGSEARHYSGILIMFLSALGSINLKMCE